MEISTGVYLETGMLSYVEKEFVYEVFKIGHVEFHGLCCVLGMFTKKLINPFANIITEVLHIPGGISTGFSIMFLVIATEVVKGQNAGI